jgi:adenylate cyclase
MDSAEPVAEPAGQKRLAVFLAVDAAGYSARSEQDEAEAVRAVQALARQIETAALAHGGRVFNTAGDGFMLEFPTVSGALAAAEAICRDAGTPVRVGMHLGEATLTGAGDLLGHGVNVAARLQALARPGSVLVSDAVRRTVTGPEAGRFRRQGRVRLDKMSQSVELFTLVLAERRGGVRRRRPWLAPVVAALGALLLAGAGYWAWRAAQPHELRVAVEPILPEGKDAAAAVLVDGLAQRISASLADHQALVVPAEAAAKTGRGGARLLVGGSARRVGDMLMVDIQLEDRRGNLLLWSTHFERPVTDSAALGEQVTVKVTDVVGAAVQVLQAPNVDPTPQTLKAMLKMADLHREGLAKVDQMLDIDRQLVQLAPRLSQAHGQLSYDLATVMQGRPAAVAAPMEVEARAEAATALKLDPGNADAYAALVEMVPPQDYAAQQALIDKAMQVNPQNANLNNGASNFLRRVGRNREAEPLYRRGLALDPMSPAKAATVIFALAGTGRIDEAWPLAVRALEQFPYRPSVRRAYVYNAALYMPPDAALKAIDTVEHMGGVGVLANGGAQAWRDFVNGARRGRIDPAAIGRFRAAALAGVVDPTNAAPALAMAGDLDGAFAVFNRALDVGSQVYPAELFETAATPMRRDPRFEALVGRLGILNYWKRSRIPPDFCGEPDAPPLCATLSPKRS